MPSDHCPSTTVSQKVGYGRIQGGRRRYELKLNGVILRSGPANSETAEMGVLTYLGWLVLAGVETRWNVMGAWPPSRMQKLYLASCGRHDELGM